MNIGQLKEYLKDVPDHFTVSAEGCDCTGRAFGIEIDKTLEDVLIARTTHGKADGFLATPEPVKEESPEPLPWEVMAERRRQ